VNPPSSAAIRVSSTRIAVHHFENKKSHPKNQGNGETEEQLAIVDGFSHLVIHVTDLDRSEAFYRDVIGLDVIGRDLVNDQGPNLLLAMNTRQRVLLVEVPEVVAIRPNSSTIHHAWLLTIEELERTRERMEKAGYDVSDSRAQFRAMGEYSMDIYDPDGHRYQIQAYGPDSTAILCENTGPINCGHMDDFPVGTVKSFVKGKFFLVRADDGFLALSRWCTHLNGLLSWKKSTGSFTAQCMGRGSTAPACPGRYHTHACPCAPIRSPSRLRAKLWSIPIRRSPGTAFRPINWPQPNRGHRRPPKPAKESEYGRSRNPFP
jgi:catechol 2,3-dioxygenase-like lactoylglutathione lyase family enzyme